MRTMILFSARNGPEHKKLARARSGFAYLQTNDAMLRHSSGHFSLARAAAIACFSFARS